MSRDRQWERGPCRSRRPVPARDFSLSLFIPQRRGAGPFPNASDSCDRGTYISFELLYNCTRCIIAIVEIVIDTSAILAVVGEQPEKAGLVRLTRGAILVAPASVHWEVGNALSAMFKRRAIGIKEAFQLLDAYTEIPIRMAEVGLKQAVELSGRLNVYAYDAYVLACAINQRAPLLTLDGGLRERARELTLDVLEANLR
jgi:predicted nucleic acid-binding protein